MAKGLFPLLDASIDSLPRQERYDNCKSCMGTITVHYNETKRIERHRPTHARRDIVFLNYAMCSNGYAATQNT